MTSILKADTIQDTDGNNIINENSNTITIGASGDTITIPSGATLDGSNATLAGIASTNGITMVDEFRLTSNFSGNANPIASNLERVDSGGQGQFGTGMTESSGTFTFPSTGYYLVIFNTEHYLNADDREINGRIRVTTNNSSYSAVARGAGYINGTGSNTHTGTTCMSIIDVTDTANVKVQFRVTVDNSSTITISDTNTNTTSMLFMRLGDT